MPDLVVRTLEPGERAVVEVPIGRMVAWLQQTGAEVEVMRSEATGPLFEAPRCRTGWSSREPGEVRVSSPFPSTLLGHPYEKAWLFWWPYAYGAVWIPDEITVRVVE